MGGGRSVAVYARISQDAEGLGLGVQRQLEDCRKLAAGRGWGIGEEYVDNDVSAYSGRVRPSYQRMLTDLAEGRRDAVIVYNLDRLHRRPVELEAFVELCERVGVRDVATVTADIDLGNDDGLFMARIFAAFAAKESGRKSARQRRSNDQRALAGEPWKSGVRPFGYDDDRTTIRETEATVYRELVARYCAGESLRGLTAWLNQTGVPTIKGGAWKSPTVRSLLNAPRYAGLRTHRGEVIGPGTWPAIITVEERDRLLAIQATRTVTKRRAPRSRLLTRMLVCAHCEHTMYAQYRYDTKDRRAVYTCVPDPDQGGCGRMSVVAEKVEDLITEAVLTRLDSPELAAALAGHGGPGSRATELAATVASGRAHLDELATLYATGDVTAREWMLAKTPIQNRISTAERELANLTDTTAISGLVGNAEQLRERWAELTLDRRQAIIRAVLDKVVIHPSRPTSRFDMTRVQPVWRF